MPPELDPELEPELDPELEPELDPELEPEPEPESLPEEPESCTAPLVLPPAEELAQPAPDAAAPSKNRPRMEPVTREVTRIITLPLKPKGDASHDERDVAIDPYPTRGNASRQTVQ